jgi:4a-hydroxytetrahydrobiopterin dehydratase
MPARTPLDSDAIESALSDLPGWSRADDSLEKTFKFDGFPAALAFIVRVGFEAEALDHHPEIQNVYDKVTLGLSTHDAGDRVTEMDVELAGRIEAIS